MYNDSGAAAATGAVIFLIVWLLLAVGILVWYLWAMARLFPRIGLKSSDGWIPIWNQWKLLERAGLPGWVVLLSFIGLSIVPFIMLIIAMHRINSQYGAGAGYTVLGVFIAPLWAMLLANHIAKNAPGRQAAPASAAYGQPGAPQAGYAPNGGRAPAYGAPGAPGVPAAQGVAGGPAGHSAPGFAAAPAGPGRPAAPSHAGAPTYVPAPANAPISAQPAASAQPAGPADAQGAVHNGAQNSAQSAAQTGVQPGAPRNNSVYAPPASASASALPWAAAESVKPVAPAPGQPQQNAAPNSAAAANSAAQAAPSQAAPHAASGPLGGETEAEYQRLAAEGFQAPPAVPLGRQSAPAPFSWTAASRPVPEPVQPPAPPAPPVHPFAAAPPMPSAVATPAESPRGHAGNPVEDPEPATAAVPVVAPAPAAVPVQSYAPAAPAESAPSAAAENAAAPVGPPMPSAPGAPVAPAAPVAPEQANIEAQVDQFAQPNGQSPAAPAAASSAFKPTGITGRSTVDDDATIITGASSEDLDRTVVVARKPSFNWVLELADGTVLNLEHDTVVGRRPEAIEGAFALAIPDVTRTLSKSHARLRFDGEAWTIEDLGSTNGLLLIDENGAETDLSPHTPTRATQRLLLGTLEVKLRPGGDAA